MNNLNPITTNETRIILSFAMADHGANFAYWLRVKLNKHFQYYGPNNVYMDCVASRAHKMIHHSEMPDAHVKLKGVTHIAPDRRDIFQSQGYFPIGASYDGWNESYTKAMSEAHTMIMVITPSYLDSQWCALEWAQFQEARKKRPSLKGIALRFFDAMDRPLSALKGPTGSFGDSVKSKAAAFDKAPAAPIDTRGATVMNCHRAYGAAPDGLWHKNDWSLSAADLDRLFKLIGKA